MVRRPLTCRRNWAVVDEPAPKNPPPRCTARRSAFGCPPPNPGAGRASGTASVPFLRRGLPEPSVERDLRLGPARLHEPHAFGEAGDERCRVGVERRERTLLASRAETD